MPTGAALDPRRFRPMSLADPLAVLFSRQQPPSFPASAYPIKEGQTIDLPANAAFTTVVTFQLPTNMVGLLSAFVYGCNTVDDFSFVRWQLRINGQPKVGYDNMVGPMATFVFPEPVQFWLPQDSTVVIVAAELGGLNRRQISAGLMGRGWPMNQAPPEIAALGQVR